MAVLLTVVMITWFTMDVRDRDRFCNQDVVVEEVKTD